MYKQIIFVLIMLLCSTVIVEAVYRSEVYDYTGRNIRSKVNYSLIHATNVSVNNCFIFTDNDEEHLFCLGAVNNTGDTSLTNDSFVMYHPENHVSGSYLFEVSTMDGVTMWNIKKIDNGGSGVANSWAAIPDNDLDIIQKNNRTAISLLTERLMNYGIQSVYDYSSGSNRTGIMALYSLEAQQMTLHNDLGNGGLDVEGFFENTLSGSDHNIENGSIHVSQPVTCTSGFEPGDNFSTLNVPFSGSLSPFENNQSDLGNWQIVSDDSFCLDSPCAFASAAGSGEVVMIAPTDTQNINGSTLQFTYSLSNFIGSATFTATLYNSTASEVIFTDTTDSVIKSSQVISLNSVWDNLTGLNLSFECSYGATAKPSRRCYIDTVILNGTFTGNTTAVFDDFNSEICFGDGSRGSDGNCSRGIFYDRCSDTIISFGTTNFTGGGSSGGVSGSGTANNIPKWSGGTSLTNSQITDDGTIVSMNNALMNSLTVTGWVNLTNINDTSVNGSIELKDITGTTTIILNGTSGKVGIGTATPVQKLDIVGNLNVTGNINVSGCIVYNGGTLGSCV